MWDRNLKLIKISLPREPRRANVVENENMIKENARNARKCALYYWSKLKNTDFLSFKIFLNGYTSARHSMRLRTAKWKKTKFLLARVYIIDENDNFIKNRRRIK